MNANFAIFCGPSSEISKSSAVRSRTTPCEFVATTSTVRRRVVACKTDADCSPAAAFVARAVDGACEDCGGTLPEAVGFAGAELAEGSALFACGPALTAAGAAHWPKAMAPPTAKPVATSPQARIRPLHCTGTSCHGLPTERQRYHVSSYTINNKLPDSLAPAVRQARVRPNF